MDLKLYLSILRIHSEQLSKMATELSRQLDNLEQQFAEEEQLGESNAAARPLEGMAELNGNLLASTDLCYRRLHEFLSTTLR
jgi:hypothetical protein